MTQDAQAEMPNPMISAVAAIRPPIMNGKMEYFNGSCRLNARLANVKTQVMAADASNRRRTGRGSGITEASWEARNRACQNAPLATSPLKKAPRTAPASLVAPRNEYRGFSGLKA